MEDLFNKKALEDLIDERLDKKFPIREFMRFISKNDDFIEKVSKRVLKRIGKILLDEQFKEKTIPSRDKSAFKPQDKITGKDVQELIDPGSREKLREKLVKIATKRNKNKQPYNIRRTVNFIIDNPRVNEISIPELSEELSISSKLLGQHLRLLKFRYDNKKKRWLRPMRWE